MFSSDKPIEKMQADMLNRTHFAKQLARAILSYKNTDNFTIGLCGKWGSGKTSIINLIVEEIQEITKGKDDDEKIIVVNFNPWNYSDRNQLISQFFQSIQAELKLQSNNEKIKKVGEALEKYSGVFDYATLIPGFGMYLTPLSFFLHGVGGRISKASKQKENLNEQKKTVIDALSSQSQKILVIIDDIDRLNNDQIRLIFQLVNSVAGFPNIIYLLSFDKSFCCSRTGRRAEL